MKIDKQLFITAFFLFLNLTLYSADTEFLINTGHIGPVVSLAEQAKYDILFSAGNDGTIRGWNPKNKKLEYLIQASYLPLAKLALHPFLTQLAVLESDNIRVNRLSIWDWKQKKKLFSVELTEAPVLLAYSPQGNFIIYTKPDWKSIVVLDSQSGKKLNYLSEITGFISKVILSASEKTAMTYNPYTGDIEYWQTQSGARILLGKEKKESFKTVAELKAISITQDRRQMLGVKDEFLYLINLTNGKTVAKTSVGPVIATTINNTDNSVACLIQDQETTEVKIFNFSREQFRLHNLPYDLEYHDLSSLLFYQTTLFAGKKNGDILRLDFNKTEPTLFAGNILKTISAVAFRDNLMTIATDENIICFESDFFLNSDPRTGVSYFNAYIHENPFQTTSGLTSFQENRFILWKKQRLDGKYVFLNPVTGEISNLLGNFTSSLLELKAYGTKILTIEKNGTCKIIDSLSGSELFTYKSRGLLTGELAPDGKLIVGGNHISELNTSLLLVNTRTSETVPLQDNSLLIYSLKSYRDGTKYLLYSLGFDAQQDTTRTVLKEHSGKNFDRLTILSAFNGEDQHSSFAIDPQAGYVYSSLGYQGVSQYTNHTAYPLQTIEHMPRIILIHNHFIYSLNTDSSISVWNKQTRKKVLDYFIFKDLKWLALFSDGEFYGSKDVEQYITISANRNPFVVGPEYYRRY